MATYVVTYYRLHFSPGPVVGPFNSREEALSWAQENDQYIDAECKWEVNEVCASHVIFGNRSAQSKAHA